jgi:hypothetical protein
MTSLAVWRIPGALSAAAALGPSLLQAIRFDHRIRRVPTGRLARVNKDNAANVDASQSDPESSPAEPPPDDARAPRRPWRRRHPLAFGIVVGLLGTSAVAAVGLLVMAALTRPRQLTRAAYEAAAARWDANGPASYNLDVELAGGRPGHVHVEVRKREVTRMVRDGVVPAQQRTWYYWSVPGMFDTIEQELDMAQDPVRSYGASGAARVAMWADFDPKYGYPRQFDRVVLGADLEVHWKVTRFEPLGGEK